jgi:hypothetical protein
MILIVDDCLPQNLVIELNQIIHSINGDLWSPYRDTFAISLEKHFADNIAVLEARHLLLNTAKKHFNNQLDISWSQFVAWPPNSSQSYHVDRASDETQLTSIAYLNTDFDQGQTIFKDGTKVSPVSGRAVFFNGQLYKHAVSQVLNGTRMTLPIWYKHT